MTLSDFEAIFSYMYLDGWSRFNGAIFHTNSSFKISKPF